MTLFFYSKVVWKKCFEMIIITMQLANYSIIKTSIIAKVSKLRATDKALVTESMVNFGSHLGFFKKISKLMPKSEKFCQK